MFLVIWNLLTHNTIFFCPVCEKLVETAGPKAERRPVLYCTMQQVRLLLLQHTCFSRTFHLQANAQLHSWDLTQLMSAAPNAQAVMCCKAYLVFTELFDQIMLLYGRRDLKSLRDLTADHVTMLKNIKKKACKVSCCQLFTCSFRLHVQLCNRSVERTE